MSNNYLKVKIEGKNVNNYIKWLITSKISIIGLNIINHNELELTIFYEDYKKLFNYSKTYKITIIKTYGRLKLLEIIKNNFIIIISILLSVFFLYLLSNIVFSINIMYNDKDITNIIDKELLKYNIKKYHFKKSHEYIEKVKKQILNDNKDILEWIEFEEEGTKYVIRLVERKKIKEEKEFLYQSIVSKKDATIVSIKAINGEKIKNINQYVKKGEVVINGIMTKPDGTHIYTKAKGNVYGEVWYKAVIEYPLHYQEEKITGKHKKIVALKILNNKIPIFPYKKYKQFRTESTYILKNSILPIGLIKDNIYEVEIKEEIYTPESAKNKAIIEATKKLLEKNSAIKEIKDTIILEESNLNSKIKLNIFISVIEDITGIIEVKPEEVEN